MSWRHRIADKLFGDVIADRLREASLVEEDRGWRSLGQGVLELPYSQLVEQMRNSTEAYRQNPLAYRIIEMTADFILGKGMRLLADDGEVQEFVTEFWEHPMNRLPIRQFELCTELSLSGELFITFHTNPYDRMTYIRCIPASSIDQIDTNPEDIEEERRFHQLRQAAIVEGLPSITTKQGDSWWD
ncbi:MAG: hypothetical protein Q8P59_14405, partial [Dehalococcoidia bacterium]|nr:hypothetical protein [Dehalococcoidia bacterium]